MLFDVPLNKLEKLAMKNLKFKIMNMRFLHLITLLFFLFSSSLFAQRFPVGNGGGPNRFVINAEQRLSLSNAFVSENSPVGTIVGEFHSITRDDQEGEKEYAYYLIDENGQPIRNNDNGLLRINDNQLLVSGSINYEVLRNISLKVKSKVKADGSGFISTFDKISFLEEVFEIRIVNVNEAPEITDVNVNAVNECVAFDFAGMVSGEDPDGDRVAFSLVESPQNDSHLFRIDASSGKLSIQDENVDFEQKDEYLVTIRVTDEEGLSNEQDIVVSVEDSPEESIVIRPESENGSVISSDVKILRNGYSMVVWEEEVERVHHIYVKKYNKCGDQIGRVLEVNPSELGNMSPKLEVFNNGSFVVSFFEKGRFEKTLKLISYDARNRMIRQEAFRDVLMGDGMGGNNGYNTADHEILIDQDNTEKVIVLNSVLSEITAYIFNPFSNEVFEEITLVERNANDAERQFASLDAKFINDSEIAVAYENMVSAHVIIDKLNLNNNEVSNILTLETRHSYEAGGAIKPQIAIDNNGDIISAYKKSSRFSSNIYGIKLSSEGRRLGIFGGANARLNNPEIRTVDDFDLASVHNDNMILMYRSSNDEGEVELNITKGFLGWRGSLQYSEMEIDIEEESAGVSIDMNSYGKLACAYSLSSNITIVSGYYEEVGVQQNERVGNDLDKLSLGVIQKASMRLYPNPTTNGKVKLAISESGDYQASIFNITGKKVYSTLFSNYSKEIDLKNQEAGVYLISVEDLNTGNKETVKLLLR